MSRTERQKSCVILNCEWPAPRIYGLKYALATQAIFLIMCRGAAWQHFQNKMPCFYLIIKYDRPSKFWVATTPLLNTLVSWDFSVNWFCVIVYFNIWNFEALKIYSYILKKLYKLQVGQWYCPSSCIAILISRGCSFFINYI